MSETSKLPWELWGEPNPQQVISSPDGFVANTLGGNDLANAKFIVMSCNAHAALVAALDGAKSVIDQAEITGHQMVNYWIKQWREGSYKRAMDLLAEQPI